MRLRLAMQDLAARHVGTNSVATDIDAKSRSATGTYYLAGKLGLALEALRDLDVARAIDRAHRTRADARLDLIAIREDRTDQGIVRLGLCWHQNLPDTPTVAPPWAGATTSVSWPDVMNR